MKPYQLDQQRADMMEALYERSGRTWHYIPAVG
jgi:hypothetical protein